MTEIERDTSDILPTQSSELSKEFKKRFDLNKFEEIWNAFSKGAHRLHSMPKYPTQTITHYYTFGGKIWKSDFWVQYVSSDVDNEEFLTLNIKLYNDGYIRDKYKNFSLIDDNMYRGWFKMEIKSYNRYFEFLRKFAKEYWMKEAKENPEMTIMYNYDHQCVDIDVYVESLRQRICLSYKPGFPESDWKI